jgi:tetratricopeptide (TPR) repeat protein
MNDGITSKSGNVFRMKQASLLPPNWLFVLAATAVAIAFGIAPAAELPAAPLVKSRPITGAVAQDAYALTNDFSAAEAQVKANPDDPEARFLLAVAYSRTPYVERALEQLDISRRLARKSKEGFALFDRKIAEYERALRKDPDDKLILYRLGFGYYMRGYAVANGYMKDSENTPDAFYGKSEQTFRRLADIDPGDISTLNYLGFLLAEREPQKNYDAAVALWERSIRVNPENPGAYMLLGQAAMQKGNLRQAVEYSAQALKARNAWLEAHQINPATLKIRL